MRRVGWRDGGSCGSWAEAVLSELDGNLPPSTPPPNDPAMYSFRSSPLLRPFHQRCLRAYSSTVVDDLRSRGFVHQLTRSVCSFLLSCLLWLIRHSVPFAASTAARPARNL